MNGWMDLGKGGMISKDLTEEDAEDQELLQSKNQSQKSRKNNLDNIFSPTNV